MFLVIFGIGFATAAHANLNAVDLSATTFTVAYPTVAASESRQFYTLTLAESSIALHRPGATVSLTCGPANASGTSLFAVSVDGQVQLMGRKRGCRASLEKIAATPARFSMNITLTPLADSRTSPGAEFDLNVVGH